MMERASAYIPMDWRQAMARGETLPEHAQGAALFADISGFTPLTETLALELGPRRGAEELTAHLNRVYDALIAELHRFGGSVIGFSGDAITCWLDGDDGARAVACALAMQAAMQQFAEVRTHSGRTVSLGMKVAIAVGPVRRFRVGDPQYSIVDTMAGSTLERLALAEHHAERGEVVVDSSVVESLGEAALHIPTWRTDDESGQRFAVVAGLTTEVAPQPWPELADDALTEAQQQAWLLPPVYARIQRGQEFLAELRPATALFLRFGGIDYEGDSDAATKLDTFIRQVEALLARYEGSLIQLTVGDKGSYLYAAFGAPIAHEDDTARAAATALELQALAHRLPFLGPLQIGITIGRMRVGAYGSATRRTYGVLGDATNLSARLMSAAEPGQILVSDEARQAIGDGFTWEQMPNRRVKGKSQTVTLARLVGRTEARTIRLMEPHYALPMVGRQAELQQVEAALQRALQGQGQIVGITAEAGMGKSRLAVEVIARAYEHGFYGYGGECQSYGTYTSYLVWQTLWRGFFGVDPSAPLDTQQHTLEKALREINPTLVQRLPLLGAVLNLSLPDNDLTRSLDPKQRKSSLHALLIEVLQARAQAHPILLVLEDCHWIDPLSRELIEEVGRAIAGSPVLMLLLYRPPDVQRLQLPDVEGLPYFSEIALDAFTPAEAERLITLKVQQFFGEREAPAAFIQQVTEQAAGNPFYIEEILNYLQDLGVEPDDQAKLAQIDLPDSLYNLILSRIDQLNETQKITLKVASVIGRLFPAAMLWGVYPELGQVERVRQDLHRLSTLELTPLDTPDPELSYLFKHIMTQQVAYESLLYATRATLHEQIGKFIEEQYGEQVEQYVYLLAHHYDHSENAPKRREFLRRAGDKARTSYANSGAIDYYTRLLPLLPDGERDAVHHSLGRVQELVGEWEAAASHYEQALALAGEGTAARALYQAATADLLRKRGDYAAAAEWLAQARSGFDGLGDRAGSAQVLHYEGILAGQQGDFEAARRAFTTSLDVRREMEDAENMARMLINLGVVARRQDDLARARAHYSESLSLARQQKHRWLMAGALNNLGMLDLEEGEYAQAREHLEEALGLWREIGERWSTANTLHNLANVARAQHEWDEAHTLYRESVAIWQALEDRWTLACWFEDYGCLAAAEGRASHALHLAGVGRQLRDAIGSPLSPTDESKLEAHLAPARAALDETAQQAAHEAGRAMAWQSAIAFALNGHGGA